MPEGLQPSASALMLSIIERMAAASSSAESSALEDTISRLEAEMEAAASSYSKLQELMEEKDKTEGELEAKMERWVYLNNLAERIASQK